MNSEIHHLTLSDSSHLKVQSVHLDRFDDLRFLKPVSDPQAFHKLCDLYRDYIIPKYPLVFGTLIHFYAPEDLDIPFSCYDERYGMIYDKTVLCNVLFHKHIHLHHNKLSFDDNETESLFHSLQERNCLRISKGKLPTLSILPVSSSLGFLSETEKEAKLKVNASFFLMDLFDLGSIYDQLGTPFGLCVKDGTILQPPLFDREVLLMKNDHISITNIYLNQLDIYIDGVSYRDGRNASFLSRPKQKRSPSGGYDIIVINDRVIACKEGGNCEIPSSGFVIHLNGKISIREPFVTYQGLEDVSFALQVGNSVIKDGKMTETFLSPFYKILEFWKTSYPPSMYPHNYHADRAPRIVLGADQGNKPMLLWFEGAAKFGHDPLKDSVGASLSEAAEISKELGMQNGTHLDGGGSAQILLDNQRELTISDRKKKDLKENERAIPMALYVP
ncbi:MAG: phosphodiester glycosidase family protein [Erysipelotrichaceae bacterium]|nr:phosphodiester glycosidase family protein [Erysipelotrichaceae bacterium]